MTCAILILLIAFVSGGSLLLMHSLFQLSPRTAADVIAVVHWVNEHELEDLLDPLKQVNLLSSRRERFRQLRERARLLREYLRRAAFNALMVLRWGYAEFDRYRSPGMPEETDRVRLLQEMTEACLEFRLYFLVTLGRLSLWMLLHPVNIIPVGGIATMRQLGGIDGLETYQRITHAAESLSLLYGEDAQRQLRTALRGIRE